MIRPRIILARGIGPLARDAIVLDHKGFAIWHRGRAVLGEKRPGFRGHPRRQFLFFAILLLRCPHLVSHRELVEHMYGEDADGGASDTRNMLSVMRCYTKPVFAGLGFDVVNAHGRGYFLRSRAEAWNEWKAAA